MDDRSLWMSDELQSSSKLHPSTKSSSAKLLQSHTNAVEFLLFHSSLSCLRTLKLVLRCFSEKDLSNEWKGHQCDLSAHFPGLEFLGIDFRPEMPKYALSIFKHVNVSTVQINYEFTWNVQKNFNEEMDEIFRHFPAATRFLLSESKHIERNFFHSWRDKHPDVQFEQTERNQTTNIKKYFLT